MDNAVGSHHDALESYQNAVALAPSRLIHRVELGRTLHRLGKKEQARQELEVRTAEVASAACLLRASCRSHGVFFLWCVAVMGKYTSLHEVGHMLHCWGPDRIWFSRWYTGSSDSNW